MFTGSTGELECIHCSFSQMNSSSVNDEELKGLRVIWESESAVRQERGSWPIDN